MRAKEREANWGETEKEINLTKARNQPSANNHDRVVNFSCVLRNKVCCMPLDLYARFKEKSWKIIWKPIHWRLPQPRCSRIRIQLTIASLFTVVLLKCISGERVALYFNSYVRKHVNSVSSLSVALQIVRFIVRERMYWFMRVIRFYTGVHVGSAELKFVGQTYKRKTCNAGRVSQTIELLVFVSFFRFLIILQLHRKTINHYKINVIRNIYLIN